MKKKETADISQWAKSIVDMAVSEVDESKHEVVIVDKRKSKKTSSLNKRQIKKKPI